MGEPGCFRPPPPPHGARRAGGDPARRGRPDPDGGRPGARAASARAASPTSRLRPRPLRRGARGVHRHPRRIPPAGRVMPSIRPPPFDAVFGPLTAARFAAIREGLAAAAQNPRARDGFLLVREVVELMRDLRPEEGLGEAVAALAALVHHAYLYWMDGERVGLSA